MIREPETIQIQNNPEPNIAEYKMDGTQNDRPTLVKPIPLPPLAPTLTLVRNVNLDPKLRSEDTPRYNIQMKESNN